MEMDGSSISLKDSTGPSSPDASESTIALPTKYDNIEPISPGKNAKVFKAIDSILNRRVFLKVYPIVDGDLAEALREPRTVEEFSHECLAQIYSATLSDNHFILELELLERGSLQDHLDRVANSHRWLRPHRVLDLVRDAACGLAHLHAKGYVHRDIKPANLMLRAAHLRIRLVVSDFGLAARLGHNGRAQASQHARLYRPAEAFTDRGYSVASDIYQLGLVLAQMFGATIDYSAASLSDAALLTKIERGEIAQLDSLKEHACPAIQRLVRKCVCREEQRLQSCGDLIAQIELTRQATLDWQYTRKPFGFQLSLRNGLRRVRVTVRMEGRTAVAFCERSAHSGKWRRTGQTRRFRHRQLARCREFQTYLNECAR